MSSEIDTQIEQVLNKDVVNRHSYFQLKYFVINTEPTHQSKLWRCIKEMQSRHTSIEALKDEIDNQNDDLEILNIKKSRINPDDNEENPILIRKMDRQIKNIMKRIDKLEKQLSEAREEANFFLKSYQTLEKVEPLKDFDDFNSQQSYWSERFSEELNLRALLGQLPDFEVIKSILSLNNESPIKNQVINMLEKRQKGILAQLRQDTEND